MTTDEIHQRALTLFRERTCAQRHIQALQQEIATTEVELQRLDIETMRATEPDIITEAEEKALIAQFGGTVLAKACLDCEFDYACRLRSGEVVYFRGAKVLSGGWVELTLKPMDEQPTQNRIAYPADRGLEVRVSDIVWIMDAPNGS